MDFDLNFYVRGKDVNGDPTVLNLTGYTLEAKLIGPGPTFTQTTMTATFNDAPTGFVNLSIARAVTGAFPSVQNQRWYFAMTNPAGKKLPYMSGKAIIDDPGDPA